MQVRVLRKAHFKIGKSEKIGGLKVPILEEIRDFVVNNFMFGDDEGLTDDTSFRNEGVLDSTGVLELITFLEDTYGIRIADEEVVIQNLDSLRGIEDFVSRKTRASHLHPHDAVSA